MYTCYHDLANYFLLTDDGWLSNYFIEKSLNISLSKNSTIDARKQAEAHCNLGLANERSSKNLGFQTALKCFSNRRLLSPY